jgi:hypothetical protein
MSAPQWLKVGIEFIESGVQSLSGEPTERDVRLGIIELSTGMELLLKGRLAQEHWPLAFDDPKIADKEKYASGTFTSLGWEQCIDRLDKACGVKFEEKDQKSRRKLRDTRNKLMHQGQTDDIRALTAKAAQALKVSIDVHLNHVSKALNYYSWSSNEQKDFSRIIGYGYGCCRADRCPGG